MKAAPRSGCWGWVAGSRQAAGMAQTESTVAAGRARLFRTARRVGGGGAMDIGVTFWPSPNVGFWVGGGAQGWSMEEESFWLDDGGWASIEGDVAVAPFGASLLLWGDLGNGFALQAEGGLRYAVVDSDASVESVRPYGAGRMVLYEDPIEIDDTVLAVASLQIEYNAAPWVFGFGGVPMGSVSRTRRCLGRLRADGVRCRVLLPDGRDRILTAAPCGAVRERSPKRGVTASESRGGPSGFWRAHRKTAARRDSCR